MSGKGSRIWGAAPPNNYSVESLNRSNMLITTGRKFVFALVGQIIERLGRIERVANFGSHDQSGHE